MTSVTRQLFSNPCTSPTPSKTALTTTNATTTSTGMLASTSDPLGNPATTYSYSSTYSYAYPTQICNPLSQCSTYQYDSNSGLMTHMFNPNSTQTSFSWDCMLRPIEADFPDGGQETISYNYYYYSGCGGASGPDEFTGLTFHRKVDSSTTYTNHKR